MEIYKIPRSRSSRVRGTLPFAGILLAVCVLSGAIGMRWNRTRAATVTIEDAVRLFQVSRNAAEREQALGAIARRARELVALLRDETIHGETKMAEYARGHLVNIATAARQ